MNACKNCRAIVEGGQCKLCGSTNLTNSFKGKIAILDPETSQIAQKMGISKKGDFAIKV